MNSFASDVFSIAVDEKGNVWYGVGGAARIRYVDGTWGTAWSQNTVWVIKIDDDNNVWLGTQGNGVIVISPNGTQSIINHSNSGIAYDNVTVICFTLSGDTWFGFGDGGTSVLRSNGTWETFTSGNSDLISDKVYDITADSAGNIWFGTDAGISVLQNDGTFITYSTANAPLIDNIVYSVFADSLGDVWVGTNAGVSKRDPNGHWISYPMSAVYVIRESRDGRKWFGTSGDGLRVYNLNGYWENIPCPIASNTVRAVAVPEWGDIWIGYGWGGYGIEVCWGTGSPFGSLSENAYWQSSSIYRATYDITSAIPKGTYKIKVSDAIDSDGMKIIPFLNATFNIDYTGSITDKTPPLKPTVIAWGDGGLTTHSASWSSSDPESPITRYRYAIGTSPGGRDVVDWTYLDTTSMTQNGLHLTSGVKYYVSVAARNEGGLWSDSGVSNAITAGVAPPGAFGKSNPSNNALNQALNPTFKWVASTNAVSYEYCLDAETVNNGVCDSGWKPAGSGTSKALTGLTPSTKYYWQMRAISAGGITQSTGLFWSFKTKANPLTSRSIGAGDGWILESAETGNKGGTINASTATFRLGDDAAKRQYRSILSFDTGVSLPDNAVITKVTLKVKRQGIVGGGNPVTAFQGFIVDMRKGTFGTSALQVADWQANANKTYGPFTPALTGGWYTFNLTSAKAYINKLATGSGLTQIRLCFKLDDNDNAIANYLSLYSGNAGAASRPQLIIEYYVP